MRSTAFARSSIVRNHALVGESGNKNLAYSVEKRIMKHWVAYQYATEVSKVNTPVIIINLESVSLCKRENI